MRYFLFAFALIMLPVSVPLFAQEKPVLTVYTYDSFNSQWGAGPQVEEAFEALCGCDLVFVAVDSSSGILSRVQLEGANSPADVVLGLDNSLMAVAENSGLIQPHGVDISGLNAAVRDTSVAWENALFLPFDFGYFAFIYSADKIQNPPTSFEELIALDESIKIVIQDPRSSTSGFGLLIWVKALYGDAAGEIWRQLAPRILTVTKGWGESYSLFLAGEADMVLSYTTSPAYHILLEQEHKYKAAEFSAGHGIQVEVAAMLKNASNPELARRFLKFVTTKEFQTIIPTTNWMFPAFMPLSDLPLEFRQLTLPRKSLSIDPQDIAANRNAWIDEFNQALSQ